MTRLQNDLAYTTLDSPIGTLLVAGDGDAVHLISFPEGSRTRKPESGWRRDDSLFKGAARELDAYFAGDLRAFGIPFKLTGTAFQKAVWEALLTIRFGETASYGAIAGKIGLPSSARAVGAANGANPIPIVVPCHRVIGANGHLTGFGGGIETKRYLLELEQRQAGAQRVMAFGAAMPRLEARP